MRPHLLYQKNKGTAGKGQKQVRDPIYKEYKIIWDMFLNSRSTNYLSGRDQLLLGKLTLLTHLGHNPDFFEEVCTVYKIPPERMHDKKVQKWAASKEKEFISRTVTLEKFMNEIPALLKAKPHAEKWFVDYFGMAAKRYVPDYAKYDPAKTKKKADFQGAFIAFSSFLNGATCKKLGYTRPTYRNFTETIRPKGHIVLLYIVHMLFNGPVDLVEEEIAKLLNEIKTKLNCNDRLVAKEAIKRLFLETHPEHDYETIIESVLREK